jgi:Maltokinase N-terminal cap domain
MALLHEATVIPSKLELLTEWLPGRSWFTGDAELRRVAAFRFDDPAGEVGVETFLVSAGGEAVFQVPLTYRNAALPGKDDFLLGTTEHSVLGTRWVYDGCADPVWAETLATAILTGGTQAEEFLNRNGRLEPRAPSATAKGSGAPGAPVPEIVAVTCIDQGALTLVQAGAVDLVVARVVGTTIEATQTLTVSWPGNEGIVLAGVRLTSSS